MKVRPSDTIVPGLLAALGAVLIVVWLGTGTLGDLKIRVPGLDHPKGDGGMRDEAEPLPVAGVPIRGDGAPADLPGPGAWPWFRGADYDGVCRDPTPLARTWPADGPTVLWTVSMGEGYASAAIRDGCVFVLDYDEAAGADTMRCFSLEDGREIWRNSYPILVTRNHGMSRTVPAIVGDCVISLGPRCHVVCWDAATGNCRWLVDLVGEYGATVPRWYAGQCPLIDRNQLILAPFGDAMLIALDYETGNLLWKSPNPRGWRMTHASVAPMEFEGRRIYICCGTGGVAGVDAEDGSLLWDSTEWPEQFATSPSPVPLPNGRIFLSSGYANTIGSLMLRLRQRKGEGVLLRNPVVAWSPDHATKRTEGLQNDESAASSGRPTVGYVSRSGDRDTTVLLPGTSQKSVQTPSYIAEVAFRLTPKQFNSEQQTPIFFENHLYAVRKRGGGQLVCMELDGKERWNSGSDRFGHGPYLIADGLIYVMDNRGKLTMAEATPNGYNRLGRYVVFDAGHDAWGPMALVAGRLIVRDMTRMTCLDVAGEMRTP